jgi:hypothetical protein
VRPSEEPAAVWEARSRLWRKLFGDPLPVMLLDALDRRGGSSWKRSGDPDGTMRRALEAIVERLRSGEELPSEAREYLAGALEEVLDGKSAGSAFGLAGPHGGSRATAVEVMSCYLMGLESLRMARSGVPATTADDLVSGLWRDAAGAGEEDTANASAAKVRDSRLRVAKEGPPGALDDFGLAPDDFDDDTIAWWRAEVWPHRGKF